MIVLKTIAKLLLFPVAAALTLIQWIGIFLNSISGVVMGILSFLFVLTGLASLLFGLASGPEFLKMMITAFVIFLIYIYFASKKTRAEIERDPEAYFSQSFQQPREKEAIRSDAIDAEYTEKVIDSE